MSYRIIVIFFVIFFFSPSLTFAAPYGTGSYGEGLYGVGEVTATPTPTSVPSPSTQSIVSSVSNAITTFFCTTQAPSSAPLLYEIDVTATTVQLFFTPASGPADSHYISYGLGTQNVGYGTTVSQGNSQGAITYTINDVTPNTLYTFQVRGGNGCKPGNWSNTLMIKTQPQGVKKVARFYPTKQASTSLPPQKKTTIGLASRVFAQPKQFLSPTVSPQKNVTTDNKKESKQISTPQRIVQPSLWDSVTNFFSSLF